MGPTITPPTSGGCYSNNYKDCLAGGSTYASCNNIWLPNGAQDNCVALWGDCPERLVVDLLNALAMVTLLHVFHLRMLHLLQLLRQLRLAVQRVSLVKVKKIAVKRSVRRENARSKIICILSIIMCNTVFVRLIVAFCIWSVTCAYPYSYKILLL